MKRIVIAGGSGFLGRILAAYFREAGNEVTILARSPGLPGEVDWNIAEPARWASHLEGADVIVNLAGRTVNCRYTESNRAEIMESRIESTNAIARAIQLCKQPPAVWINASTATIYKHTYGQPHGEQGEIAPSPEACDAFSIEVARAWEKALFNAAVPNIRKVALRTAMVLGHGRNSVLPMLCRLTRLGLGGRMGDGRQYVSWIHQRDFCRAVDWILEHAEMSGVVNVAAPNPITNAEMMRIFRKALGAPFGLPAARWMLEAGAFFLRTETELILKSRRVIPKRLLDAGFQFQFADFECALQDLLLKSPGGSGHGSDF